MAFSSISERGSYFTPQPTTGPNLGPGAYDFVPKGEMSDYLKKKLQSRNPGAFNSHEVKSCSSYLKGGYTPGPGLYSLKQRSVFSNEYIKSDEDPSQYFQVMNGNLVRKVQTMASNLGVPKILDVVKERGQDWQPGPGRYSPRNNMGGELPPLS